MSVKIKKTIFFNEYNCKNLHSNVQNDIKFISKCISFYDGYEHERHLTETMTHTLVKHEKKVRTSRQEKMLMSHAPHLIASKSSSLNHKI